MNVCLEFPEPPENLDPVFLFESLQFHRLILQEAFEEIWDLQQKNGQLKAKCERLVSLICSHN